jgi:DNA-directed RNA polymerase specialized sigma24 family protein
LHYIDQLSIEEIGEVMGVSPGAVKAHLHKARAHLSQRLETWGEETT